MFTVVVQTNNKTQCSTFLNPWLITLSRDFGWTFWMDECCLFSKQKLLLLMDYCTLNCACFLLSLPLFNRQSLFHVNNLCFHFPNDHDKNALASQAEQTYFRTLSGLAAGGGRTCSWTCSFLASIYNSFRNPFIQGNSVSRALVEQFLYQMLNLSLFYQDLHRFSSPSL